MLWYFHLVLMLIMSICDGAWIWLNLSSYTQNIINIQNTETVAMRSVFALPIYIVMYMSVIIIAVPLYPTYDMGSGALVGFSVYSTYNLCLLLQFENSSVALGMIDTIWGTLLFMCLTKLAVTF